MMFVMTTVKMAVILKADFAQDFEGGKHSSYVFPWVPTWY